MRTIPTDGMTIRCNTTFEPGVYLLPAGLTIAADGVTVDGCGALLVGQGRAGSGVRIAGHSGVTVKNLRLIEYYHGIVARQCRNLTITGCQVTASAEIPANTIFLDIWAPAEQAHGGGLLLWQVEDSLISENDLQHQMSGLLSYQCRRLTVRANLANYCSGWGFHLNGTCDSLFEDNYADFCCRYEPRGARFGHMGADAAGFLIISGSSRNVLRRNFARMSGDGFFLAGLPPDSQLNGCNDNLFEGNDGSYSPNIAFEATFSRGNTFIDNHANYSNYGFWLGFSSESLLESNRMIGNRQAGIAVENGVGFRVRKNLFQANGHGILLWSKRVPAFEQAAPKNLTSCDWLIEENTFNGDQKGIRIAADQDHGIRPLAASGEWGLPASRPHDHTIRRNSLENCRVGIELLGVAGSRLQDNQLAHNLQADLVEQETLP
jgi:parallel beta-helix repeat protein